MDTGSSSQELDHDYSQLTEIYLQVMRLSDGEKLEAEFKQKIGTLMAEIERTAPNLKALDQYEALQSGLIINHVAADKCNSVKPRRYELFMEAFDHVSKGIDKIYKQLTKGHTRPLRGTAYLNLENEDDPFLHSITHTQKNQCFRGMKQLSGGEKTVAALALLFAIHNFRQSPFYILDEVDAAI
uniref:RecF/RecN/SMC N-terminal domain-containing protein n=1 Tax=Triticum urartu TaxID=4572 RepID=A0A8R7UYF2_TRIUA